MCSRVRTVCGKVQRVCSKIACTAKWKRAQLDRSLCSRIEECAVESKYVQSNRSVCSRQENYKSEAPPPPLSAAIHVTRFHMSLILKNRV